MMTFLSKYSEHDELWPDVKKVVDYIVANKLNKGDLKRRITLSEINTVIGRYKEYTGSWIDRLIGELFHCGVLFRDGSYPPEERWVVVSDCVSLSKAVHKSHCLERELEELMESTRIEIVEAARK
jgi:hypothetical protein